MHAPTLVPLARLTLLVWNVQDLESFPRVHSTVPGDGDDGGLPKGGVIGASVASSVALVAAAAAFSSTESTGANNVMQGKPRIR